jgi:hypothetical protein
MLGAIPLLHSYFIMAYIWTVIPLLYLHSEYMGVNPRQQYHCWTSNAVVHHIVLLMMDILIPETC